jgi:hypothetical protein
MTADTSAGSTVCHNENTIHNQVRCTNGLWLSQAKRCWEFHHTSWAPHICHVKSIVITYPVKLTRVMLCGLTVTSLTPWRYCGYVHQQHQKGFKEATCSLQMSCLSSLHVLDVNSGRFRMHSKDSACPCIFSSWPLQFPRCRRHCRLTSWNSYEKRCR